MSETQFILDAINGAYIKRKRQPGMPLRPSSLGACDLKNALLFDAVGRAPRSPESLRVLERGTQRDEALSQALKEGIDSPVLTQQRLWIPIPEIQGEEAEDIARVLATERVQVRPYGHVNCLWYSGSADAILVALGPEGEDWLLDWKTAGSYGFVLQTEKDGPSEEYVAQLDTYAWAWEIQTGQRPRVALIFESQDSDARKGIVGGELRAVELEPEHTMHVGRLARERMTAVLRAWRRGETFTVKPTVPGPSPQAGNLDWRCCYCDVGPQVCGAWGEVENVGTEKRPKWRQVQDGTL